MAKRLDVAKQVLDKYYHNTEMSPFYAAALILNPARRTRYIEVHWPKESAQRALVKVRELWEKYREEVKAPQQDPFAFKYSSSKRKKKEREPNTFNKIAMSLSLVTRPSSQDEYDDYNTSEPYDPGKQGALKWWLQDCQRQRWPRLSLIAIEILSIPLMSDELERVFSGARRTITWERAVMTAEILEIRECLKY